MGQYSIYNEIDPLSDVDCDERMRLTFHLFDGSTDVAYFTWRKQVIASLATRNKLEFLERIFCKSDSATSDPIRWERSDYLVKRWILNSLSEEVKKEVPCDKNACDIWDTLESRYGEPVQKQLIELRNSIASTLQTNELKDDVSSSFQARVNWFFNELRPIWQELDRLEEMIGCRIRADRDDCRLQEFINRVCNYDADLTKLILCRNPLTLEAAIDLFKEHEYSFKLKSAIVTHDIIGSSVTESPQNDLNHQSSSSRGSPETTNGGKSPTSGARKITINMTTEGFQVLEKSLREYIKATPSLSSKLGNEVNNLEIEEVGDVPANGAAATGCE